MKKNLSQEYKDELSLENLLIKIHESVREVKYMHMISLTYTGEKIRKI